MKKLLVIVLAVVAVCLVGSVAYAADNHELSVNITSDNPVTREIDQMAAFPAYNVTSADRDSGMLMQNTTSNLIISSNSGWKLQGKVTNAVGAMGSRPHCSYSGGGILNLTGAYADIGMAPGNAGGGISAMMMFGFDIGWTSAPFTNSTVDLYVKILSNV